MNKDTSDTPRNKASDRDERLRAALRANLQRRKAQARGRATEAQEGQEDEQ